MYMMHRKEMPQGFGMALFQNDEAKNFFESCTKEQQEVIVAQARAIDSKNEMKAFVDHLPSAAL